MPFKDKNKWLKWNKERCKSNTLYIQELKSKPCTDCGLVYPHYVMEFDHVPGRGKKKANVASLNNRKHTSKGFQDELKKCDLVCANCHKIREHTRGVDQR